MDIEEAYDGLDGFFVSSATAHTDDSCDFDWWNSYERCDCGKWDLSHLPEDDED